MEARLRAKIWIQALIRRYDIAARPAVVIRRGDPDSGDILIKLARPGGFIVLSQTREATGELAWLRASGPEPVDEASADSYIAKRAKVDPDLWAIEIEDPVGTPLFDGRIL